MASLYDIFFQHHNDVVAITQRNVKLHVIAIPIFNVVLISDKDENAINNGKHVVLFHLSKYSDKLYDNIVYKVQIHCVKCVKIQSYFRSVFSRIRNEYGDTKYLSVFSPNAGKYGPEITPYLDTFHAVIEMSNHSSTSLACICCDFRILIFKIFQVHHI